MKRQFSTVEVSFLGCNEFVRVFETLEFLVNFQNCSFYWFTFIIFDNFLLLITIIYLLSLIIIGKSLCYFW